MAFFKKYLSHQRFGGLSLVTDYKLQVGKLKKLESWFVFIGFSYTYIFQSLNLKTFKIYNL